MTSDLLAILLTALAVVILSYQWASAIEAEQLRRRSLTPIRELPRARIAEVPTAFRNRRKIQP